MMRETYQVTNTDDEPVGFVSERAPGRVAFGLTRTGQVLGVAADYRLAALQLRDMAEARR